MNSDAIDIEANQGTDSQAGFQFEVTPGNESTSQDDFQLKPGLKRKPLHSDPTDVASVSTDVAGVPTDVAGVPMEAAGDRMLRQEGAANTYNSTSGTYPNVRHYPTLESMQRLYKIFGYVTVGLVFPYLAFRLVYILLTTDEHLLHELGSFSELAVPMVLASVAITATLFGAAEGIRLAMDIQDNTLRLANHHDRHRR